MEAFWKAIINNISADIILDAEHIIAYNKNVTGYEGNIQNALAPNSKEQVISIIKLANSYHIPLYPISTGKNWGMGSKLPVKNGCVLLDLQRINRIIEVNEQYGYAIVEPGVTQKQLADYLEKTNSSFFLDVTGSSEQTSILGNCLERGTAYNTMRAEIILGLEVILGTGEELKTGFAHYPSSKITHLYKHGVGPDLTGCFVQSNLGVVVAAAIKLLPIPEVQTTFSVRVNESDLFNLIEKLSLLKKKNYINSIVHIGDSRRSKISLEPILYNVMQMELGNKITRCDVEKIVGSSSSGDWNAIANLMGSKQQVRVAKKIIKKHLGSLGKLNFLNENKLTFLSYFSKILRMKRLNLFVKTYAKIYGMTKGKPYNESLRSIYWPHSDYSQTWQEPDLGNSGILFFAPLVPVCSDNVKEALSLVRKLANNYQLKPAITLNTLTENILEMVISVDFRLDNKNEKKAAHDFKNDLGMTFTNNGMYPYRLGIKNMDLLINDNSHYWLFIKKLKSIFDPNNIIAPGRYNLL